MTLSCRLNGERMQHATTEQMIFKIPKIIEYVSTWTTLEPGDVLVTGTPGGVGARRTPPVWMKPGDKVEIEIDKVGILENSDRRRLELGTDPSRIRSKSRVRPIYLWTQTASAARRPALSRDVRGATPATLERLLADSLVYTHSYGGADGKASYLDGIRAKKWQSPPDRAAGGEHPAARRLRRRHRPGEDRAALGRQAEDAEQRLHQRLDQGPEGLADGGVAVTPLAA